MFPKCLLTTTTAWPTAARLAGAFARLGWQVEVLGPRGNVAAHSRFVRCVHPYAPLAPLRALKRAISAAWPDLVIPCDDRAVAQLLAVEVKARKAGRRDLAGLISRSLGAPAAYPLLYDRARFAAIAEAEGIRVPASRAVANRAELEQGLAELGLPAVLKADGSWGGEGVAIVRTRKQARAAFRRMSRAASSFRSLYRAIDRRDVHHLAAAFAAVKPNLSLQAYIPGTPATAAFACWQGAVMAAIDADVVQCQDGTGPASVVRMVADPAMADAARKIARRFGLSGLHGLDFLRDEDGDVHLLEINPRATPISSLALGRGRDLPAALAAAAGLAGWSPCWRPAIANNLVALFPQEWRRDPASAHFRTAYHDVPWDDPALIRACLAAPGAMRSSSLPMPVAAHRPIPVMTRA